MTCGRSESNSTSKYTTRDSDSILRSQRKDSPKRIERPLWGRDEVPAQDARLLELSFVPRPSLHRMRGFQPFSRLTLPDCSQRGNLRKLLLAWSGRS